MLSLLSPFAGFGGLSPFSRVLSEPKTSPFTGVPTARSLASRTEYERLSESAAVSLAKRTFGVGQPTWTAPWAVAGGRLEGFINDFTAEVSLPHQPHTLVRSSVPLRVGQGSRAVPLSLSLKAGEGGYVPAAGAVPIVIARGAAGGVALPDGIDVSPQGVSDVPGEVVGNRLVYANVAADTDLMTAPTPTGAEMWWQLRSARSSPDQTLLFSLSRGETLAASKTIPGGVALLSDDVPVLEVLPATATDAAGGSVPVTYTVARDVVKVHVALGGDTDFPVLVDPDLSYVFSTANAPNWYLYDNGNSESGTWLGGYNYDYYGYCLYTDPIEIADNGYTGSCDEGDALSGSFAEWYWSANQYVPGTVRIYRADVAGFQHGESGQSAVYIGLWGADFAPLGSDPVYTFSPSAGEQGADPFGSRSQVSGNITFCAQYGGGADGSSVPLCSDSYNAPAASGGAYFLMQMASTGAPYTFDIARINTSLSVDESDVTPPNVAGASFDNYAVSTPGATFWTDQPATFSAESEDDGAGVLGTDLYVEPGYNDAVAGGDWPPTSPAPSASEAGDCDTPAQSNMCDQYSGASVSVPNGLWTVTALPWNPFGLSSTASYDVGVDTTAPSVATSGSFTNAVTSGAVTDGSYQLAVTAQDNEGGWPQSGIASITATVDGQQLDQGTYANSGCPAGASAPSVGQAPPPGCETDSLTLPINTSTLGEGEHTLVLTATDWAGNSQTGTTTFVVKHAAQATVGPGSVNLVNGEYVVEQQDVSVPDFAGALTVSRTSSSTPTPPPAGVGQPFGSQWSLDLPGSAGTFQTLSIVDGVADLTDNSGATTTFSPSGSSFEPPPDLTGWALTGPAAGQGAGLCAGGQQVYQLTDPTGDVTTFAPVSGSLTLYMPCSESNPAQGGPGNVTSVLYETDPGGAGVVPETLLAPVPTGVSCSASSLVAGCRALEFTYASSTTATGTGQTDWGNYTGQLSEIDLVAYDPQQGEMTTTAVAKYLYDDTGALRAEWDPRISPALQTTYSYNGQGLLSTMTPPGQAAWSFTYSSGASPQLLSVSRQDPNLASPSTWSVVYNVPVSGTGAPYAMDASSVAAWAQADDPATAVAIFPPDEVPTSSPPADYNRATIYYLDAEGREVNVASPGAAITTTEYDPNDNPIRTLTAANRALAMSAGSNSASQSQLLDTESTYNTGGDAPAGTELVATLGPQHTIYVQSTSGGPPTAYTGRTDTQYTYDQDAPSPGGPFYLVTTETQGAEVSGQSNDLDVTEATTSYSGQSDLGWTLHEPTSVTSVDPNGSDSLTTTTTYDPATGLPLSTTTPAGTGADAHTTQTIYYSAAANPTYPACGNQPGLANLPCQTQPAAQPASSTTPTFVQEASADAGANVTSLTVTPTSAITAGDRLIAEVGVSNSSGATAQTVSDSAGDTYTELEHFASPSGVEMSVWTAPITAGGGTRPTITVTPTSDAKVSLAALEYSGLSQATGNGVLDTATTSDGTTSSAGAVATGGTHPASGNHELALGLYLDAGSTDTLATGTGYAQRVNVGENTAMEFLVEDQTVSAGATPSASATTGANTAWLMSTLLLKPEALPTVPVATYGYNMWDEVVTRTETGGSGATRLTTSSYDGSGRPVSTATHTQSGPQLPAVTYGYDPSTGLLTTQTAGGQTITTSYDPLGRVATYADADGNTSTYGYDVDGRLSSLYDGKGTQTYGYDPTTGYLTSVTDTSIGSTPFTATYNADGAITNEVYPNGMTGEYTYDPAGQLTNLSYVKTSDCATNCTWYQDSVQDSSAGQALEEASTLGDTTYTYDYAGRLTGVQDTTGQGTSASCTTRTYTFDADSNRTSLTTAPPAGNGSCSTTGGTAETYSYDAADRLIDGGVSYDAFGDLTALSAADAGGQAFTGTYYSDGTTASITQEGLTVTNSLDPTGRTDQQVTSGTSNSTVTMHYSGAGDSPGWTIDGSGNTTRYVEGIDGSLAAIQANAAAPILQVQDLEGDIVAQAALSPTATGLLSTSSSNEYGVPDSGSPAEYSWLGADRRETELPSGVVAMGSRTYVPQMGMFLQPDPVTGGSASPYGYADGDPVNNTDLSGNWVDQYYDAPAPGWVGPSLATLAQQSTTGTAQGGAAATAGGELQPLVAAPCALNGTCAKCGVTETHPGPVPKSCYPPGVVSKLKFHFNWTDDFEAADTFMTALETFAFSSAHAYAFLQCLAALDGPSAVLCGVAVVNGVATLGGGLYLTFTEANHAWKAILHRK